MENATIPFAVGEKVLIRTVTSYFTGQIASIVGKWLVLDKAAWIADTGRFADAIKRGSLSEVEPMGNGVRVNSDTIIDAVLWAHELPLEQK